MFLPLEKVRKKKIKKRGQSQRLIHSWKVLKHSSAECSIRIMQNTAFLIQYLRRIFVFYEKAGNESLEIKKRRSLTVSENHFKTRKTILEALVSLHPFHLEKIPKHIYIYILTRLSFINHVAIKINRRNEQKNRSASQTHPDQVSTSVSFTF